MKEMKATQDTDTASHLHETARAALNLNVEERISYVRNTRWIGYTRAKQVLQQLEELFTHPKTHRMPNLLLVGETNNGKTMIVNRFHQQHLAYDNPDSDGITLPVMVLQCPPVPDEGRFYDTILEKLFAPYKPSDRAHKKQFQVLHLLRQMNTKMLILDEIQHIIAGTLVKQRHFLNTLKYLGNELQIPLVGVGTKEAFHALQTDPQLANRFEPLFLPRWDMDQEYLRLLASFERMLPLRQPSGLVATNLALKLLTLSEGTIGELAALLTRATVQAIRDGREQITSRLLDNVDWTPPSKRKREPK